MNHSDWGQGGPGVREDLQNAPMRVSLFSGLASQSNESGNLRYSQDHLFKFSKPPAPTPSQWQEIGGVRTRSWFQAQESSHGDGGGGFVIKCINTSSMRTPVSTLTIKMPPLRASSGTSMLHVGA